MSIHTLLQQLETESGWRSIRAAQKALRDKMGRPDRLLLAKFLQEGAKHRSDYDLRSIRVSIASDASLDNFVEPLALRLLERGLFGIQYHAPFGQMAMEIRNPNSDFLAHQPEVAVIAPLAAFWQKNVPNTAGAVTQTCEETWSHVTALRNNFSGLILLQNLHPTERRPHGILDSKSHWGRADFARAVNLQLSQRCRETSDVFILDAEFLAGQCGASWPGLHKQQFMGSRPVADDLASQLAAETAAFCAARKGFARKCLAVDFDNTLWGGVVGEDGVAGVQLASGFPGTSTSNCNAKFAH